MKIKVTEIEATAEDLRQSKTLSEAFSDILRYAMVKPVGYEPEEDEEAESE